MSEINFFFEETEPIQLNTQLLSDWLYEVARSESHEISCLNYIICSDEYLYRINLEYLEHDYYTDVITFDNSEEPDQIEGDIYMSIDTIRENASTNQVSELNELRRIMVHGILHLLGYQDKSPEQKEVMTKKENAYLSLPKFQTN